MQEAVYSAAVLRVEPGPVRRSVPGGRFVCTQYDAERVTLYLEGLTLWVSQRNTLLFFRRRAEAKSQDEIWPYLQTRADAEFASSRDWVAFQADNVTFADVQVMCGGGGLVRGRFLSSVQAHTVEAEPQAATVELQDMHTLWFPDVGMRLPPLSEAMGGDARAFAQHAHRVLFLSRWGDRLQNLEGAVTLAVDPEPAPDADDGTGGNSVEARVGAKQTDAAAVKRLLAVYAKSAALLHALRYWAETREQHQLTVENPRQVLLTLAQKYQKTGPRAVWHTSAFSVARNVFPLNTAKGITKTLKGFPLTYWAGPARAASVEYFIPALPLTPQAADPKTVYEVVAFISQRVKHSKTEYLTYWKDYPPSQATWESDSVQGTDYNDFKTDMHETWLPLLRQGAEPEETALSYRKTPRKNADDAFLNMQALKGENTIEALQTAALMGTEFHNNVTHALLAMRKLPIACMGHLGLQLAGGGSDERQRAVLDRVKKAILPQNLPPTVDMARVLIDGLEEYVASVLEAAPLEWLYTEFPVYFPYVAVLQQERLRFFETRADAIVAYTEKSRRVVGVVEFKSLYGRTTMAQRLPDMEHVAQAVLTAFMFWTNTGTMPERVFVVYVTRHKKGAVFAYRFAPKDIPWQADFIKQWVHGRGEDAYYMDRRYLLKIHAGLLDRKLQDLEIQKFLTPIPGAANKFLEKNENYAMDGVRLPEMGTMAGIPALRMDEQPGNQATSPLEAWPSMLTPDNESVYLNLYVQNL